MQYKYIHKYLVFKTTNYENISLNKKKPLHHTDAREVLDVSEQLATTTA